MSAYARDPHLLLCPTCPHREKARPFAYPTGPKPCSVMLIGEGPAGEEIKRGHVFAGKTGQELDGSYLSQFAGLSRDAVYVTNASKCAGYASASSAPDNPSDAQARACAAYLLPIEIREVQPKIIVVMGAIATRAVIGDGIDMELQHGIPLTAAQKAGARIDLGTAQVVTPYHPSAGLHETAWMAALQDDFATLREIVRGRWRAVVDPYPEPYYFEASDPAHVDAYISGALGQTAAPEIGLDTETDLGRPWCVTVSAQPGTGMLIDARRADLLTCLQEWINMCRVGLHSAMADLPVVQKLHLLAGLGLNIRRWVDTMQQAYWAREFRIGLKPLAYRHLGMRMQEYKDVVTPPSVLALHEYMSEVQAEMLAIVPTSRKPKSLSDAEKAVRHVLANVKRVVNDIEAEVLGTRKRKLKPGTVAKPLDPWTRIDGWEGDQVAIIEALGPGAIPRESIAHVDRDKAIWYACRDSDATLRLMPVIARRAQQVRRKAA